MTIVGINLDCMDSVEMCANISCSRLCINYWWPQDSQFDRDFVFMDKLEYLVDLVVDYISTK